MGKNPFVDKALASIWICKKCKARNPAGSESCRKCHYTHLRPKRARKKEPKGK